LGNPLPSQRTSPRAAAGRVLRWALPLALLVLMVELAIIVLPIGRRAPADADQATSPSRTDAQPTSTSVPAQKPTLTPVAALATPPVPTQTAAAAPPPTLAPPTLPPTMAPTATSAPQEAAAGSPGQAVASFYQLVSQQQFDLARQLWTARMQAAYPPAENIRRRFAQTEQINLRRADIVTLDEAGGRATVAVDLVEVTSSATRRYVGTWQLVRVGGGWLLDQPNLQAG
jgi:hypothetical protein